ncbi:Hypothetical predicted protein [Olea europaea subsp. europaea]|uniref:Uncharacterized protein n=1 Tax=Olea europaea subsp. europaea TaxID=158383 RepID=A0A8S0QJG9_OLEEU|nr:Hypothetical predicted protein [Olea europaea subsp. europaea]
MLLLLLLVCEGDAMTKESMASRGEGEVKVQGCRKEIELAPGYCDEKTCKYMCTKLNRPHVTGRCIVVDTCLCEFPC